MRAEQLILDDAGKAAIKRFRDSKPWRGTFEERLGKFTTFYNELADACAITATFEFVGEEDLSQPGNGGYDPENHRVVLAGKLSAVTLLFCFGLVGGLGRREALNWSSGLFRHYFPRSFRGCDLVNGLLVRRAE